MVGEQKREKDYQIDKKVKKISDYQRIKKGKSNCHSEDQNKEKNIYKKTESNGNKEKDKEKNNDGNTCAKDSFSHKDASICGEAGDGAEGIRDAGESFSL